MPSTLAVVLSSEEEEEAEDDSNGGRVGVSRPVEVGEKTSCFKPLHMTKSERVSLNTAGRRFFPQQKTLQQNVVPWFRSTAIYLAIYVQAEINIKIWDTWR